MALLDLDAGPKNQSPFRADDPLVMRGGWVGDVALLYCFESVVDFGLQGWTWWLG